MTRIIIALVGIILFGGNAYGAEPKSLRPEKTFGCTFGKMQEKTSDKGAIIAGKLFSLGGHVSYLTFRFDGVGKPVVADLDLIFKKPGRAYFAEENLRVEFYDPKITGLEGRGAKLVLVIDKFTLEARLILDMKDKGGKGPFAYWLRKGKCHTEKIN